MAELLCDHGTVLKEGAPPPKLELLRYLQMMSLISFHTVVKLRRGAANVYHRWLQAQLLFVLVAVSATTV